MIKELSLKYFLIIMIFFGIQASLGAQCTDQGGIYIEMKWKGAQAKAGMEDYENYDRTPGFRKPDIWYFLKKANIRYGASNKVTGFTADRFYENSWSSTYHTIDHFIRQEWIYGNEFNGTNSFDLSIPSTLMFDFRFETNEEDRGFSTPYNGDDDYGWYCYSSYPFTSNIARNGSFPTTLNIACGPKEYTYSIEASYFLDALQPNLRIEKASGGNQDRFCKGEQYKIVADYKGPFHNGYFHWQKDHGNGVFVNFAYGVGNVITDYASNSNVRYRCRLIADSGHYGVSSFSDCNIPYSLPIEVRDNITDFTVKVKDECPSMGGVIDTGKIQLINIANATVGANYKVQLRDDFFNSETKYINGYTNDYLSNNEVSFKRPRGTYYLLVTHNDVIATCGIEKTYQIKSSVFPDFTAVANDPFCFGGQGWVDYSNITLKNDSPPFDHILRATSLSGEDVFENSIDGKEGLVEMPPGSYIATVENSDGCMVTYPDTMVLLPKPELTADFTLLDSFERDGIFYHESCQSDRADIAVNITGGVPPYTIVHQNFNKTFLLAGSESYKLLEQYLSHGSHTFYIRDAYNCATDPILINVNNPSQLVMPSVTGIDPTVSCNEVNYDGRFVQNDNPSGGIAGYTYFVDGIEVPDFNVNNLPNTTSVLRLVDEEGCSVSQTISISNFSTFSVNEEVYPDFISCDNQPASIQLFINNGTPSNVDGYTVLLNGVACEDLPNCQAFFSPAGPFGGANGEVYFTTTTPGDYFFEISDSLACKITKTFSIRETSDPVITFDAYNPPACPGGIFSTTFYLKDVNFNYGTEPSAIYYNLDGGGSTYVPFNRESGPGSPYLIPYEFTIPITGEGAHTLDIQDSQSCGSTYSFTLEGTDVFDMVLGSVNDLRCYADTTGSIALDLEGDAPFTLELFRFSNRVDSISTISNKHIFTNLAPGEYSINARDRSGCPDSESGIMIAIPNPLAGSLASTSMINCTGINGEISVSNVTGGTAPYTYALNGGAFQTSPTLTGATLENTVTIQDAMGCYLSEDISIPAAGPTLFSTMIEYIQASDCSTGAAIIELQAGFTFPIQIIEIENPNNYIAPSIFEFGDTLATEIYRDTFYNLKDTIHYFLIQDGLGCEKVDSLIITKGAPLAAEVLSKTNESCFQQTLDGTITIGITGGVPPYSMMRDTFPTLTSSNSVTVSGLITGQYDFVIKDAAGCMTNVKDSIISGSLPEVTALATDFSGCKGNSLLSTITMTGINGTAPFTFLWEDGNTDNPRMNVSTKEYHVTVTDAIGCTTQETVFAPGLDSLILSLESTVDNICQADTNGEINVNSEGGFAPLAFSIDGGMTFQTDSLFSGLSIGDYVVLVKDDHDCVDTITSQIIATNPLSASVETTDVDCNASANGSLEISLIGGVGPFMYSLDDVTYQASNIFENLPPGTYSGWIQDGSGCKAVYQNFIISEPAALALSTSLINDETCGNANASAQGFATGGTPPYTYEWDGNSTLNTAMINNASAGLHTLVITDANGCTQTSTLTINNQDAPILNIENSQEEICGMANGQINLGVINGTAPFTFDWSHDPGLNDSLAINLSAANYSVTITDANMCSDVLSFNINEVAAPSLSEVSSTNSLCTNDNGEIILSLSDGTAPFTYSWSHDLSLNDSTATGLADGNYTVTVTDANGCSDEFSTSIAYDAAPVFQNATIINSICESPNGSIDLTTTGGVEPLTYSWSHDTGLNNPVATDLIGGIYEVTVTDANGCQDILTDLNVNTVSVPNLEVTAFNNADCLNPMGDITIGVTGGVAPFTYAWSHDVNETGTTLDGLVSGTYTATVTDANGCEDIVSQSLISFVGSSEITSSLNCFGDTNGAIDLSLEGNLSDYQYAWSDSSIPAGPTASNLGGGIYSVTVTNANGCTEVFTEDIIEPAFLENTISDIVPVGCDGNLGSASVIPTGGTAPYTYLWDDPNAQTTAIASNLPVGDFEVLITDANGCTTLGATEIEQSSDIVLTENEVNNPLCFGEVTGSISITATGGTLPYTFAWDDPMTQTTEEATGLSAGVYNLLVTDAVGCTQVYSSEITQPDVLQIATIDIEQPRCFNDENGSISITTNGGTGAYEYVWNNGSLPDNNLISNLGSGVFDLQIIDANGCTIFEMVDLINPEELLITDVAINPVSCNSQPNGSIEITAEGGDQNLSYSWSNGSTNSILENLNSGLFELTVTDGKGCEAISDFEVSSVDVDVLDLGDADTLVCKGEALYYDFSATDYETFRWTGEAAGELSTDPIFATSEEDTYMLYAIRNDGCVVEDTIEVNHTAEFLNAFFIAPTDIVVGDTIVALEVSLPVPDRVEWGYDTDFVKEIGNEENQYLFSFDAVGEYDLTLTAFSGDCSNDITKTIFVYADSTELPFVNPLVPTIIDLKVFPNPNDGIFNISVILSEELDMVIDIFSSQSILFDRSLFTGSDTYSKDYELDLPKGIYYAIIQVAGAKRTLTLVVD